MDKNRQKLAPLEVGHALRPRVLTRGIALPALIVIIAILVAAGGGTYYTLTKQQASEDSMVEENESMMDDGTMVEEEAMMKEVDDMMSDDAMTEDLKGIDSMMEDEVNFSGTVLAGSLERSPLLDFTKSDYDKALSSDKLVVLYFYANWCPICKAEFPKAQAAFDQLQTDDVVGFRVNYNDNQTDTNETALAKQFGVAYQHTKVFVKDGERVLKAPDTWETSRYLSEITMYR